MYSDIESIGLEKAKKEYPHFKEIYSFGAYFDSECKGSSIIPIQAGRLIAYYAKGYYDEESYNTILLSQPFFSKLRLIIKFKVLKSVNNDGDGIVFGVTIKDNPFTTHIGASPNSWGFCLSTGKIMNNQSLEDGIDYAGPLKTGAKGAEVSITLDTKTGWLFFGVNG
jgi:hypothetical protein